MQQALRIGEVAETTGLTSSAIRFYESAGVLPEPARTASGYRGYSNEDVDLIRFVSRLRALELPLPEVSEIVALRREGTAPCKEVRSAISNEISAIEIRIEDLKRLRNELVSLQDHAKDLPDDWPSDCVCNVLETKR
jgi:MerR family copper efflux transcriptional regulator